MSDYTLTPKEFSQLKSKLKKLVRKKDNFAIIAACREAIAIFEEKGYPDNWSDWVRAKDDAEFALKTW